MPKLAFLLNTDLKKGFTVFQVAEKHGWPEPLAWAIKLKGKNDIPRYKELQWGLRIWDNWYWVINNLKWPVKGKAKLFDPPCFSKKVKEYEEDSISNMPREESLDFLERFFRLAGENSKKETRLVDDKCRLA